MARLLELRSLKNKSYVNIRKFPGQKNVYYEPSAPGVDVLALQGLGLLVQDLDDLDLREDVERERGLSRRLHL